MTPVRTEPLFKLERPEPGSDDYYTPPWIFERLRLRFDLDAAAPPGGVSWVPAGEFYSLADDGLVQPCFGRVWCNPPYSKAAPWVERMAFHGDGILLLPFVDSNWLDEVWRRCSGVTLLPRDMPFVRADGRDQRIMFRTALFAFGDVCRDALPRMGFTR